MIKVADFGLSENMDTNKEYFRQNEDSISKLPLRWLALESITDRKFSEKTDVVCSYTYNYNNRKLSENFKRSCSINSYISLPLAP